MIGPRLIDRFAEELSKHDMERGDPGGSVPKVSKLLGLTTSQGNTIMQNIRRVLGPTAR